MSRIYTIPFTGTITAAGTNTDIWSFQAAVNKPICLRAFVLGQFSEVGDVMEENLRITVQRITSYTAGSGGVLVTAQAPNASSADIVWSFTARTNDTTVATGTSQILDEFGWNERNTPYEHWYPDDQFAPSAVNGQGLVIRCETTLADDMLFSGTAWIEEEG